ILFENFAPVTVYIPYREGQLIAQFHEFGKVEESQAFGEYIKIKGSLPGRLLTAYRPFTKRPTPAKSEV
ncbi:MAG: hypothetical protein ACOYXO_05250, partial [Chloroflexota bacterium]